MGILTPSPSPGHGGCPPGSGLLRCHQRCQRHQPQARRVRPFVFVSVTISYQLHHVSDVPQPRGKRPEWNPVHFVLFDILGVLYNAVIPNFLYFPTFT